MPRLYWLLALCVVAALSPSAQAQSFYRDRMAMETSFGYLADVYFDLAGTGVPGAYYSFGTTLINHADIPSFAEFNSSPFVYSGRLTTPLGGDLLSSGNSLIAAGPPADYSEFFFVASGSGGSYADALGFYIETAPNETPASNEQMYGAVGGYLFDVSNFSEGGFIGATDTNSNYFYFAWAGASMNRIAVLSHVVSEPGYLTAGGDPHVIAHGLRSEMSTTRPGEIFQMVAHPSVTTNAAIRDFAFLPESMADSSYFGAVGMQLANGDQVYIEAYEEEEQPGFRVLLNGDEVAFGTSVTHRGYELHYNDYAAMPLSRKAESEFERQFPFHTQHGMVRLHMRGEIVIDVALSSMDAFVDWHRSHPEVYRHTGAFLNVNMRDLVQPSKTVGLLAGVGDAHLHQQRLVGAVQKVEDLIAGKRPEHRVGKQAELERQQQEKVLAEHSRAELAEQLAAHRSALAAYDLPEAIAAVVSQWKVEHIFE